ncbi:MAG: aspartate carbamoyltransferase catalytic subunit [Verrucomicrobiae bacterium]|nr:aspartate carbamoyltransferase catalytic subunit [Verrucomicrobiae bacterium]
MSDENRIPSRKDLLDIASLSVEEIEHLLKIAVPFKDLFKRSVKKVPALRGKTVLNLFYEPSTRTSSSFEVAASRLSADVTNFTVSLSSVVKGESIIDTIDTLQAMRTDYVVIRHSAAGIPNLIAKHTRASVVNAGDGFHAHPTQALLDMFTIREVFPESAGRKVLIVGDILHSRVARSTSTILNKLGVEVGVLGPSTLVPAARHGFMRGFKDWDEAFAWKPDIVYLLRVQLERQGEPFFPSLGEYHRVYGLTTKRYQRVKDEGIYLMHPGPVNRGVEIDNEAMTYERSLINTQVENGIAARMAVLYWLKPDTGSEARGGAGAKES